jgi:DNA (cytosine-5)-methyltransferase 1
MKVLNLYSGLGGNRQLWENCEVTSVEYDSKIGKVYQDQYPNDTLIIGDAHDYLLKNFQDFDFIWSSPPCQSHSRMTRSGRNRKPRYPDFKLYEEIVLLHTSFKGLWLVENVVPYYNPLIQPNKTVGRHLFWSNFDFECEDVPSPKNFINKTTVEGAKQLKEWLNVNYDGNLYYDGNHCPAQVLRNCVHPKIGKSIFDEVIKTYRKGIIK